MSLGDQLSLSSGMEKVKPSIEMSTLPRITIAEQNQTKKYLFSSLSLYKMEMIISIYLIDFL